MTIQEWSTVFPQNVDRPVLDLADAPPRVGAPSWKTATVVLPTPKEIVTMRLNADLLRWFRRERGYQTRINAILRAYMEAHESA